MQSNIGVYIQVTEGQLTSSKKEKKNQKVILGLYFPDWQPVAAISCSKYGFVPNLREVPENSRV